MRNSPKFFCDTPPGALLLLLLPFSPFPPFPLAGNDLYLTYAWLASLPFTLLALNACNRSKAGQMGWFRMSIILLGIVPCAATIGLNVPVVMSYLNGDVEKREGDAKVGPGMVMWQGHPAGRYLWNELKNRYLPLEI